MRVAWEKNGFTGDVLFHLYVITAGVTMGSACSGRLLDFEIGGFLPFVDTLSRQERSQLMGKVGTKNTGPERRVRSLLHRLGFRFRLHRKDLPGTPDVVLPKYRTVVQVYGCFWHRHKGCKHSTEPKSNVSFWLEKFKKNEERDQSVNNQLKSLGWTVIIIWECELKNELRLKRKLLKIRGL